MDILALSKLLQDPDLESKNVEEGPQDNNITLTPPASFGNNGGDKIKLENNLVDAENILASNFVSSNDDREEPRYQLYYKQLVGTEDVFLGTEKSPASFDSTHIILKVHFPGRVLNDLKLNVTTNRLTVESPDRYVVLKTGMI